MTDQTQPEQEPGHQPPPGTNTVGRAFAFALFMIPIGGLMFMISANTFLYGWLEIVPKMNYWEACAGMSLAWLFRFFMYR